VDRQPSRALLIAAGLSTQLLGAACLVLALASLPIVHDLHGGTKAALASVVASLGAIVCGTLVWRGRLIPLALATGLDVGLGIVLPRGTSGIGALLRMLPQGDASTAETLVTIGAIALFVAAMLCLIAIPSAIQLRRWARAELARPDYVDEPRTTGSTLRGWGTMKLVPTQVIRVDPARGKPIVIVAVAVPLIAVGIAVISASTGKGGGADDLGFGAAQVAAAPRIDAAPVSVPAPDAMAEPSLDDFLARFHGALGGGDPAALAALLDPQAFGFGVDAHAVAEGADAVAKQVVADVGTGEVTATFHQVGREGDVAWSAEELRIGGKTFVTTAAIGLAPSGWTIHALHVSLAMPNAEAYRLAREGDLAVPDAIPDLHDESALAAAMRAAFASRTSFVEARSTRDDAFNFGSAPGERLARGDAIRKVFGRIRATVHLHDAVRVGTIGTHGGWGAANVDFTDADKDGTDVTQTFRVLAVWLNESAGWRIVQTQWSNAR
jgi:ketosteroid isomerase-like protein